MFCCSGDSQIHCDGHQFSTYSKRMSAYYFACNCSIVRITNYCNAIIMIMSALWLKFNAAALLGKLNVWESNYQWDTLVFQVYRAYKSLNEPVLCSCWVCFYFSKLHIFWGCGLCWGGSAPCQWNAGPLSRSHCNSQPSCGQWYVKKWVLVNLPCIYSYWASSQALI